MHGAVNVRRFMGYIENGEKQKARSKGANLKLQRDARERNSQFRIVPRQLPKLSSVLEEKKIYPMGLPNR